MSNAQMIQHYRTKQRQYLARKSEQTATQEDANYFPPQLRQLRTDYFAKRYEKYGDRTAVEAQLKQMKEIERTHGMDESEQLADKIWKWLNENEEKEEGKKSG